MSAYSLGLSRTERDNARTHRRGPWSPVKLPLLLHNTLKSSKDDKFPNGTFALCTVLQLLTAVGMPQCPKAILTPGQVGTCLPACWTGSEALAVLRGKSAGEGLWATHDTRHEEDFI